MIDGDAVVAAGYVHVTSKQPLASGADEGNGSTVPPSLQATVLYKRVAVEQKSEIGTWSMTKHHDSGAVAVRYVVV